MAVNDEKIIIDCYCAPDVFAFDVTFFLKGLFCQLTICLSTKSKTIPLSRNENNRFVEGSRDLLRFRSNGLVSRSHIQFLLNRIETTGKSRHFAAVLRRKYIIDPSLTPSNAELIVIHTFLWLLQSISTKCRLKQFAF